ncbi:MAG TPA: dTMP kinase [Acidimicrobiales bacterium]|nr:dTMP kinase [Acidimicrobiales bacterium]
MTGRGRLIAFEGGEGAGKSTQAQRLASGIGAELTREPGGSELGERIRHLLLDPAGTAAVIDPRAELMLLLASRAQHVAERIRPALESGRDVVVDRFSGSTLAYQGYGRGLPLAAVKEACDLATGGLWPDLTILLEVPLTLGSARRAGAGWTPDRIEAEEAEFHRRVADGFLALAAADPQGWVVIDGTGAVDTVAHLVDEALESRLGQGATR